MNSYAQDKRALALEVHQRLQGAYGTPQREAGGDPVAALISTVLSQNTNDRNRDVAFRRLRERFPTWEAVRDAPPEDVVDAIRPAGLAPSKGPRIQQALRKITEVRGAIELAFLTTMPLEAARAWLLSLDGVGPKTAAIVLLFTWGLAAFPVDTHIHRVTRRLGMIPPGTSREAAHDLLEALLPVDIYYPFHINLITHGRQVCHAGRPRCEICLLQDLCMDYLTRQEAAKAS